MVSLLQRGVSETRMMLEEDSSSLVDSTVSIPAYYFETIKSKVDYRRSRPTAIEVSLTLEQQHGIVEPIVPPAPRHAAHEGANHTGYFFPSPRSVLERRSSTGSFF